MSSIAELNKKIKDLKAEYKITRNELSKLDILKQLEEARKELKAKTLYGAPEASKKEEPKKKEEVKAPEVKEENKEEKEEVIEDMNRGKVAEPGSSLPDSNKQEDKKDNGNNKHQKTNRN